MTARMKQGNISHAIQVYRAAEKYVAAAGFGREIVAHRACRVEHFTKNDLLCEAAWVILCSGFRESIVRRKFDYVSLCFCDWSVDEIVDQEPICIAAARAVFANDRKLVAIAAIARDLASRDLDEIRLSILKSPIDCLMKFDYIGPITAFHLAKNLGFDFGKPDRHLVRLARSTGFDCVADLCAAIAEAANESIRVVDLILWRYLAGNSAKAR